MAAIEPLKMGLVGLANYAGDALRVLEQASEERDGQPAAVQLMAVCSNDLERHPETVQRLRARGVEVLSRYEDLLAEPIEALWLPLPIDLHRPFTVQALEAGKAVLCEKPAAGSVQDVDAMIAARDRAGLPVAIGYTELYQPAVRQVKRLLLEGAIGRIRAVTIQAAGPRGDKYYNRAPWAGRFQRDGRWVMDSIANNAHAHGIAMALYLAGPALDESAQPLEIEAELYRANPLENYDTISARATLEGGAQLLLLESHGCEWFIDEIISIEGERGRLFRARGLMLLETPAGRRVFRSPADARGRMVCRFQKLVRGVPEDEGGVATLEIARAQSLLVSGASEATPVYDIDAQCKRLVTTKPTQGQTHAVIGMETLVRLCAQTGLMMHESDLAAWTRAPGRMDLRGYNHFAGPAGVAAMAQV